MISWVLVNGKLKKNRNSYFCIHSARFCLLVRAFNPFTFKVIIDKYDPIAIYFIVLGLSLYTLSVFPVQKRSFSICWKAGLVVLNSLSFCLSEKLLISPSYFNEILAGYKSLGCRLFSFITLSMSCHSLLAWRVSIERSAVILQEYPYRNPLVGYMLFFPCCF